MWDDLLPLEAEVLERFRTADADGRLRIIAHFAPMLDDEDWENMRVRARAWAMADKHLRPEEAEAWSQGFVAATRAKVAELAAQENA